MVAFLLDNSLGAWWAAPRLSEVDLRSAASEDALRGKAATPGVPLEYLRFVRESDAPFVTGASSPGSPHAEFPGQDGPVTQQTAGLDESTLEKTHGDYLPHWTCDNAVYHVVFRLADSVPKSIQEAWTAERELRVEHAGDHAERGDAEHTRAAYDRQARIDAYLDAGHGASHLRRLDRRNCRQCPQALRRATLPAPCLVRHA